MGSFIFYVILFQILAFYHIYKNILTIIISMKLPFLLNFLWNTHIQSIFTDFRILKSPLHPLIDYRRLSLTPSPENHVDFFLKDFVLNKLFVIWFQRFFLQSTIGKQFQCSFIIISSFRKIWKIYITLRRSNNPKLHQIQASKQGYSIGILMLLLLQKVGQPHNTFSYFWPFYLLLAGLHGQKSNID